MAVDNHTEFYIISKIIYKNHDKGWISQESENLKKHKEKEIIKQIDNEIKKPREFHKLNRTRIVDTTLREINKLYKKYRMQKILKN